MSAAATDTPVPLHVALALLLSLALWHAPMQLQFMLEWTKLSESTLSGLLHLFVTGFTWLFIGLPWGIAVVFLYRFLSWRRFRTLWIVMPGALMLAAFLVNLPTMLPVAEKRFKSTTGTALPVPRSDLHTYFFGGGLADYSDIYYFRTEPAEVEKLIQALDLKITDSPDQAKSSLTRAAARTKEWGQSAPSTWPGLSIYHADRNNWFYTLATNASRTEVYLQVSCL